MRKTIAFLLAAVMLLSLCACNAQKDTGNTGDAGMKKFTLVVVYEDKTEKTFTYETQQEFVGPVLQEAGLIKGNAGPYGLEITHVDGVKAVYAEDGAYWAVYEGEEYALQGIDTTPVVDGKTYKLVYEAA
ncbi:MAG: hypothetical protein J6A74_00320 [Oscillospiraceae bacterium]|nr:hypothetical protein [Oscillospiraceae bacterium]